MLDREFFIKNIYNLNEKLNYIHSIVHFAKKIILFGISPKLSVHFQRKNSNVEVGSLGMFVYSFSFRRTYSDGAA